MRLNPECIRGILLSVEEHTGYRKSMLYSSNPKDFPELKAYSNDVVWYHIEQCKMNDFIISPRYDGPNGIVISDLTPRGHEFLANIREKENWSAVKKASSKIGSFSLSAIEKIAEGVTTALINDYFKKIMNS